MTKTPIGTHMRTKVYPKHVQIDKDGKSSNVTKLNDGAAIEVFSPPKNKTYYVVGDKYYVAIYPRIVLKNKRLDRTT